MAEYSICLKFNIFDNLRNVKYYYLELASDINTAVENFKGRLNHNLMPQKVQSFYNDLIRRNNNLSIYQKDDYIPFITVECLKVMCDDWEFPVLLKEHSTTSLCLNTDRVPYINIDDTKLIERFGVSLGTNLYNTLNTLIGTPFGDDGDPFTHGLRKGGQFIESYHWASSDTDNYTSTLDMKDLNNNTPFYICDRALTWSSVDLDNIEQTLYRIIAWIDNPQIIRGNVGYEGHLSRTSLNTKTLLTEGFDSGFYIPDTEDGKDGRITQGKLLKPKDQIIAIEKVLNLKEGNVTIFKNNKPWVFKKEPFNDEKGIVRNEIDNVTGDTSAVWHAYKEGLVIRTLRDR